MFCCIEETSKISIFPTAQIRGLIWIFALDLQWKLVTKTAFVPKDIAIKMNLLL